MKYTEKTSLCRVANDTLVPLFTLGNLFISNFVKDQPSDDYKSEMKLMYSPTSKLVQLEQGADPSKMYGQYWYRSGTNQTMRNQLKNVVDSCMSVIKEPTDKPLWLDIACNDGTLLSYVPSPFERLGIDPADDSYTKESVKFADQVIQDYFSKDAFDRSKFKGRQCDVITCIAMFYDLPDPIAFLNEVYSVLKDDGLFVVQMSYTPLMIQQMAFDNICHEHLMYYSLHSFKYVADKANFKIVDCELNDVNGGSFRIYLQKNVASSTSYATAPYRDVARYRVNSTLEYETTIGANTVEFYMNFFKKLQELKTKTYNFIKNAKENGKSVWVYGASTKGNTLLQYFGLDKTLIDGAAERSPYKFGLKTVGTDITIYSEADMRKANPDYLLILPWHFIDEFKRREAPYLIAGGHFIVPCPVFEIV